MPAQARHQARLSGCSTIPAWILGILACCALLGACATAPNVPAGQAASLSVPVQIPTTADWISPAPNASQLAAASTGDAAMPMPDHIAVDGPTVTLSGSRQSQQTLPSGSVSSSAFS